MDVIIISDTSPIINLAAVGQLDLLRKLYGRVVIPEAVRDEILAGGTDAPGKSEVSDSGFIEVQRLTNRNLADGLSSKLDAGESEAIALAVQLKAEALLLDDEDARAVAAGMGLSVVGLIGVVVLAKKRGHLTQVRPVLDELRTEHGFWMSDRLYELALRQAGE